MAASGGMGETLGQIFEKVKKVRRQSDDGRHKKKPEAYGITEEIRVVKGKRNCYV